MSFYKYFLTFRIDFFGNVFIDLQYEDRSVLCEILYHFLGSQNNSNIKQNIRDFYNRLKSYSEEISILILDKNIKDGVTEVLFRWYCEGSLKEIVLKTTPEQLEEMLRNF